jgi:aspartate kinase
VYRQTAVANEALDLSPALPLQFLQPGKNAKVPSGSLLVQKYGGSSVANAESIRRVAERIASTRAAGHQVVVVVSAMGDTTDELLELAARVAPSPRSKDVDALLTTGERISTTLLAIALASLGVPSRTFSGSKAGLITDGNHGNAHIVDVRPEKIRACLDRGEIAIVAGFQGRSRKKGKITTLGRGGSDLTAVALAAALGAALCEIFTDVDGVFTADPRVVHKARKIDSISSDEMLELAASGAKVLNLRCVEYARRFSVSIHVRSSFNHQEGTLIVPAFHEPGSGPRSPSKEQPVISGIVCERSSAKITVVGAPNEPGKAALIFEALGQANANVDMIVQNTSAAGTDHMDLTFTLRAADGPHIVQALEDSRASIGFARLHYDDQIGKLSLVGLGMRSDPHMVSKVFKALSDAGINVELISTSEVRIAVVTRAADLDNAARAVDAAFRLKFEREEAKTGY